MTDIDDILGWEYFRLLKLPLFGSTLIQVCKEDANNVYCARCGRMGTWKATPALNAVLPAFDPVTGDKWIYQWLVCPTKTFSWRAWRTWFREPCRVLGSHRRMAVKGSERDVVAIRK